MMKLWIDDIRQAPSGYIWCHSTNQAIMLLEFNYIANENNASDLAYQLRCNGVEITPAELLSPIELVDIDHDSGVFASEGGDYIAVLNYMEANELSCPVRIHSMNIVGVQNMRAIIEYNDWEEVR
jgi:hypothetical protein